MIKIATPNQQGQIVIPAKIRKQFKIDTNTYLKIFVKKNTICLQPLEKKFQENDDEIVPLLKKKKHKPFHFKSKHPEEKNLAGKIDEILYS